jgi:hypothetical protein
MYNPLRSRLRIESLKRIAETFLGKKNFSWWAIVFASLTFLVSGWLPDGIAELCSGKWQSGLSKFGISIVILAYIGHQLKRAVRYEGRIEVLSNPPSPAKVVAIFLSPLIRKTRPEDIESALENESFSQETLDGTEWEMSIKAIEYHSPEILYVFSSKGEKGTHSIVPLFRKAIERLFPSLKVNEWKEYGIDFEDISEVFDSVEELYAKAKSDGYKENDIIVDITGGQKPNSIAGATATLAIGRKFQYVSTIDKRVLSYDIGYFEE